MITPYSEREVFHLKDVQSKVCAIVRNLSFDCNKRLLDSASVETDEECRTGMNNGKRITSVSSRPAQRMRDDKYARLVEVISDLIDKEFTGHLKINFSQGGIGRIEKFEEILRGTVTGE